MEFLGLAGSQVVEILVGPVGVEEVDPLEAGDLARSRQGTWR